MSNIYIIDDTYPPNIALKKESTNTTDNVEDIV